MDNIESIPRWQWIPPEAAHRAYQGQSAPTESADTLQPRDGGCPGYGVSVVKSSSNGS